MKLIAQIIMKRMNMKLIHRLAFFLLSSLTVAAGVAVAAQQNSTKPVSKQTSGKESSRT